MDTQLLFAVLILMLKEQWLLQHKKDQTQSLDFGITQQQDASLWWLFQLFLLSVWAFLMMVDSWQV